MTREEFSRRITEKQDTLYRVAYGLFLNKEDAADAVQEAIFKAWKKLYTLREESYFETWVVRILLHESYAILRARRPQVALGAIPERSAPGDSSNAELYEAIAALQEKLRLPIVLHYIEGYKEKEIAAMLNCPVGTVKSRLRKARGLMREALEADGRLDHVNA